MTSAVLPSQRDLFFGGDWHAPAGGTRKTYNPATGEDLGPCAEANSSDVDAAVDAAQRGFELWRDLPPIERSACLREAAARLRCNAEELGALDAVNTGNAVSGMVADVITAASTTEFFAGLTTETKGVTVPLGSRQFNYSIREPYGVCGRLLAYNHPILFAASRIGAALAAGNSLILKPPHQAPLSAYRMMELIADVFPPGVINLITGGTAGSEALVAHPAVPRISLVGSVSTGRSVAAAAALRLKHVTLELGGKNACVVYPDADLEQAAAGAVAGMNLGVCGQSCGSTTRLFVHESVYDTVVERICAAIENVRPGDPVDPDTRMGCLISLEHRARVQRMVDEASAAGASILRGGHAPQGPQFSNGPYYLPTVLGEVMPSSEIAQQEIFGPVLSILRWRDEDGLMQAVNDVQFGLTASIWTRDLARGHRAARRIDAGFIWINQVSSHFHGVSFGGVKQSGLGKEESLEELLSFTREKVVTLAV